MHRPLRLAFILVLALSASALGQQTVRVDLAYRAPGSGPAPNFSPKGTAVTLADVAPTMALPAGSIRPAKVGTLQVGPNERAWMKVLVTSQSEYPKDLCRLYVDRNRNGNFEDDGAPVLAVPSLREKTGDTWSSFSDFEITVPYDAAVSEPYRLTAWIVRRGETTPDAIRFSVRSWRSGTTTVNGVEALVAVMDSDNDAIFRGGDMWSALEAAAPDAAKRVLSYEEARETSRLMFVKGPAGEQVLEFRGITPDGRTLTLAVVDRRVTKAQDRAGDDALAPERSRPRAVTPFAWSKARTGFDAALKTAKASGKKVVLDFWTTWCGPCAMMDQWIWSDQEVVSLLDANYVGVKLDGDVEEALVKRFGVKGYPTIIVLDAGGKELGRADGYLGSKELLALLKK